MASASPTSQLSEKQHRELLEDCLLRRFFYVPSFAIYGGVAGLYDLGPPGCGIRDSLLQQWRRHFIIHDGVLEISCAAMTPEIVLKTSGHVDRFTDFMVKDVKNSDIVHRADKLLEEWCDKLLADTTVNPQRRDELLTIKSAAGAYSKQQLMETFKQLNVKSPDTGNDLTEPFAFNLMFNTQIGPTGKLTGFLRPETAQGMFVNFRRLLEYNQSKMPFGAAQIGLAFRNEIAPRSGLLRVREFVLAEIEFFVHAQDKSHSRFDEVHKVELALLPREAQTGEEKSTIITVGDAVQKGVINNETFGYYLARTQMFALMCGLNSKKLRFRQHKSNEMAHYAADCWDLEIYMNTFGWIEAVGHADRSAYDLRVHSDKSKVELMAAKTYEPPLIQDVATIKPNFAAMGKQFGQQSQVLIQHLKGLPKDEAVKLQSELQQNDTTNVTVGADKFTVSKSMLEITVESKKISTEKYIPHVIEPAFGIGRILYGVLDHTFYVRPGSDNKRTVLGVPAILAPLKVAVLPLSNNADFEPFTMQLRRALAADGISNKLDAGSVSIGRRYARADEIGTPYAVTVDFDTVKVDGHPVTVRERDSTQQVRCELQQALAVITQLLNGQTTWSDVYSKYDKVVRDEKDDS